MEKNKVKWRMKKGRKTVTLPDGSKINSKILAEKYNFPYYTAMARLNTYIKDGNYEDLIRAKGTEKTEEREYPKYSSKLTETHYEDGAIRMLFDKHWKTIASAT
jgi:hypothetical protein